MAATDQTYRNQHTLDIVFAVSSILMLISIVWMFVQDQNREFKNEQRAFRDVESAVAQRLAIAEIPNDDEFKAAEDKVKQAQEERNQHLDEIRRIKNDMAAVQPKKERAEKDFQDSKAFLESKVSFYNIEVEEHGVKSAQDKYGTDIKQLSAEADAAKAKRDDYVEQLKVLQRDLEKYETPVTEAQSAWKKVNDRFETQAKLAISKQWGFGDIVRTIPVMDAFASPIKIQQITVDDVPIDYNFKRVPRFDRCTTCHLGIERPAYTKDMLRSLTDKTEEQEKNLQTARERLRQRIQTLAGTTEARNVPDPEKLNLTALSKDRLNESRVNEYCAHPRLELFV